MDWYQVAAICGSVFVSALIAGNMVADAVRDQAINWGVDIVCGLNSVESAIERQRNRIDWTSL